MLNFGGIIKAASAAALVLALAPAPAAAQDGSVLSIPTTRPSTNPRAQGPVDDENPVVRTAPRPTPTAAPTFAPPPSPAPTQAPPQPATTAPRTTGPAQVLPRQTQAAPRPGTGTAPAPVQSSGPAIGALPADGSTPAAAPVPTDAGGALGNDAFTLPTPAASAAPGLTPADSSSGWYWPWIAGAAALFAAIFGVLWWRRREPAVKQIEFIPPVVAKPEPEAEPAPARAEPAPVPAPQPAPAAAPIATSAPTAGPLAISLEARRMNASLMATTLTYVLRVTNTTDQPLSALAVEGDMIAAHGSLPPEKQIASGSQRLELRHAMVTLAAGESAEFTGDFRLPLASLVPIRAGDAAYFVPLARWRVEASTAVGTPLVQVQTFVVGELPEQPGAALRPFRLDLGPRTYSRVGQRPVS